MDSPNEDAGEFRLRSYQAEMVEESLKQNIIVAMDTGSGKTHVAISRTAAELETCNPEQLVWFLAPTVTLCQQQACLFEKHLPAYGLRFLSGNDNVAFWSEQTIWDAVLSNVRIVVSTPAVLLDALTHGFVRLPRIALLIFDEAHMCRGNHPANSIMQRFYHPLLTDGQLDTLPGILGLTASPVVSANAGGLEIIERSLNAIAKTPKVNRTELLRFTHRPQLVQLKYPGQSLDPSARPPILTTLAAAYHAYNIVEDPYIVYLRQKLPGAVGQARANLVMELEKLLTNRKTYVHEQLKKLYSRALGIYGELGAPPTEFYVRSCIVRFDAFLANSSHLLLDWSEAEGMRLHDTLATVAASQPVSQHICVDDNLSPKANALIELLHSEWSEDFTGIVFVEQRATVAAMDHVLSNHPRLRDKFNVGTFVGTSTTVNRKSHLGIGDLVEVKHQQQTLEDFRAGKINLIVATSVLEEGIDVSNCHIVICYEPPQNLKSFIQRRGRARKKDSKFVIMFPDDYSSHVKSPEMWLGLEEQMKEAYLNDLRVIQEAEEREQLEEDGDASYRCDSTGAILTLDNAMAHLYHFCSTLGGGQHVDLRPRFSFTHDESALTTATVTLPTSVSAKLRQHRGTGLWRTERVARKDAAFQAYVELHKAGLVNDNLLPLLRDPEEEPDFGIVDKRPAMLQVQPRLDPWIVAAQSIRSWTPSAPWYRTRISILIEAKTVSLVVLLPQPMLPIPAFLLHWDRDIRYELRSEPMQATHLSEAEVSSLQHSTRTLLLSIFGSRMAEERYDYPFLIAPYDVPPQGGGQPQSFENNKRPALEVYAELQAGRNPTIGLLHQTGIEGHPLIFRGFQTVDTSITDVGNTQGEDDSLVHVVFSAFPKRRDFLHRVQDDRAKSMYRKENVFPAKDYLMDTLPASYSIFTAFLPSVLHRYELFMIVQELLCNTVMGSVGFTDHKTVLRAITASSTNEHDYQRLEFLGDCILKFSTAVQLMADNIDWPESYLTQRKDRIVSNGALAKASRRAGLDRFIHTKAFTGSKWRPRYVRDILATTTEETRPLSSKTLADVVESLIGAAYVEGGMRKAHLCQSALLTSIKWQSLHHSRTVLKAHAANEHAAAPPLQYLNRVEQLIGYTFRDKHLLLEALTHASFTPYREGAVASSSSYQRLEFLGDAVLDYVVSRKLYAYRKATDESTLQPKGHAADELPHWTMHSIRAALVNASFLAFLCMEAVVLEPRGDAVFTPPPPPPSSVTGTTPGTLAPGGTQLGGSSKLGSFGTAGTVTTQPAAPARRALWHFLRHSSPSLRAAATAAAQRHEQHREDVWTALRGARRYPWRLLARIGAEKFFSDVVEAVVGAVFVDSTPSSGSAPDDGEEGDGDGGGKEIAACEVVLANLGLFEVLERVLRDGVDTLHPKTALGRLAGAEKVVWEWSGGGGGDEGVEGEGECEQEQRIGVEEVGKNGVFRCRVGLGERMVSEWVEGHSRVDAETEAADRAVVILLAEGKRWRGMERCEGVVVGGEREEVDGVGVEGLGDEKSSDDEEESEKDLSIDGAVAGAKEPGDDVVMNDA